MKKMWLSGLVLAAGLALATGASAQTKIGVAGPITGPNASFGAQLVQGVSQAAEDFNKSGGILGQKLEIEQGDDVSDPKQGVSVANKFVGDGVKLVVGHFNSGVTIPASEVYSDNGVLFITPSATNPKVTERGLWDAFRTCGRDDQQGKVAATYIAKHFKGAKIAVLDDNSTYGKGIADQVRMNLKKLGIPDAYDTSYTAGDKDYSALISRLKQQGITLVYIGGYYADAGLIMRGGAAQGFTPQYFSEDAAQANELWQTAGPAAEGMLFTFPPPAETGSAAAAVVAELKAKNIDPSGYVLYSYATIQAWAEAAKKAHSVKGALVSKELKAGGPWATVLGPLKFDAKGDVVNAAYAIWQWHNGTAVELPPAK